MSTTSANPYQSPQVQADDQPSSPPRGSWTTLYRFALWALAYLYPAWLLGSFYVTWLIAWGQLGYRPRPSLDDPSSIGGFMSVVYYTSGLLVMLMPVLAPLGLASAFFCPIARRGRTRWIVGAVLACLYVALCTGSMYILRSDPWQVVEWWFD